MKATRLAWVVLAFAPAVFAAWRGVSSASSGLTQNAPKDAPEAPYLSLAEVSKDAQLHLGRTLRVRFQVESEPTSWNPYLTRFGSADWRGLKVWADEQFLWEREAWENPVANVFARRGSVADEVLAGAPRLARYEALAHVRQVFLGRPWIELEQVQRIKGAIGEGSVLHATRALEHVEKEQWRNALDNYDRALVGEMPDVARAELRRLREAAAEALNQR
jgi:hypothetical protein